MRGTQPLPMGSRASRTLRSAASESSKRNDPSPESTWCSASVWHSGASPPTNRPMVSCVIVRISLNARCTSAGVEVSRWRIQSV